jgi:hypothetical protein
MTVLIIIQSWWDFEHGIILLEHGIIPVMIGQEWKKTNFEVKNDLPIIQVLKASGVFYSGKKLLVTSFEVWFVEFLMYFLTPTIMDIENSCIKLFHVY